MGVSGGTGGSCQKAAVTLLALCVILLACFTKSTDTQPAFETDSNGGIMDDYSFSDVSFSQSQSSLPYTDRIPCVFRSELKLHKDTWKIDTCTECICVNGSTNCDIITCPRLNCPEPIEIPNECCPECPFKFELYDVFNRLTPLQPGNVIKEGHKNKYKFNADIEIFKKKTSRKIRGEHLWQIGAWVSRNQKGTGKKFSYSPNILNERLQNREFKKAAEHYDPNEEKYFRFSNIKYTFDASEGLCEDFKYLCIEFNVTDDPEPVYGLSLTYTVYKGEYDRQISCVGLGVCRVIIGGVLPGVETRPPKSKLHTFPVTNNAIKY